MSERFITIKEIAMQYNVSNSTVRRWIKSGKLVGHKAGVQWRFSPTEVQKAFENGILSGASRQLSYLNTVSQIKPPPEWARAVLESWGNLMESYLNKFKPQHVIVNDRRGAKIWEMITQNQYAWGNNLWHSTAIELMEPQELRKIFTRQRVMLFDEIMQHGRSMHELREQLEGVGAEVISAVCARRRSYVESGELIEYKAFACEDIDDDLFAERATLISHLAHLFEPPLDVDHLVVRCRISPELEMVDLLENLAEWGKAYLVWTPDHEHDFYAITLDRPQFCYTHDQGELIGFSLKWTGPCKIRFYIKPDTRICHCSFIAYPEIEASKAAFEKALGAFSGSLKSTVSKGNSNLSGSGNGASALHRFYINACMDQALNLLNDFIVSGAADDVGIRIENSPDALDIDQLLAIFGPSRGNKIWKRAREILALASRGKSLFPQAPQNPPSLQIRKKFEANVHSYDVFRCRSELLEVIPKRYLDGDSSGLEQLPILYANLFEKLTRYSESTIGRILDYELDSGTIKPAVNIRQNSHEGVETIRLSRGITRGEYGVWFEWDGTTMQTHRGIVIQRTLGLAPRVLEQFLRRTNQSHITATHFNKLFANMQHDWRQAYDLLYLGWKPYKYGPVAVAPTLQPDGSLMLFERFLVDRGCLHETKEKHGTQEWRRYKPEGESKVPWRRLYTKNTTAITRAHIAGLVRLYSEIQKKCKTVRPSAPRSSSMSLLQDPLIVLAAARNNTIAYRCSWFEIEDWKRQGEEIVFPMLNAVVLIENPPQEPLLKDEMQNFAASARLLFEKIQMYRNIPYLRQQIVALSERFDLEAGEVLLESVDSEPIFESHSTLPMKNMEWACTVIRAFSSLTRQILTACKLDVDTRLPEDKADNNGEPKDASFYLQELLTNCPELRVLEKDLHDCISSSLKVRLTEEMVNCLSKTFQMILRVFDSQRRIPDPRPQYERDREHLQNRDGLLVRLREIAVPNPYAIAVADIKNVRNLPTVADIFGVSYDQALEGLLEWVAQAATKITRRYNGVSLCGLPADNVVLAGPTADEVFAASLELIKETSRHLAAVDRNQFAQFGLLRVGIAWHDDNLGEKLRGLRPGLNAYELSERPGLPIGTISITKDTYDRLSSVNKTQFMSDVDDGIPEKEVFVRHWDFEKDVQ